VPHFIPVDLSPAVEAGAPDPARVISGTPQTRTWLAEETPDGKLFAGIWEATPGAWRVHYDEWEFCHILSGHSRLTEDGGAPRDLKPGDAFVIREGFRGVWEVVETTRKHFVIRLP
jgi:hypothetical protein